MKNNDRELTIELISVILMATCSENETYENCRKIAEIIYDEIIEHPHEQEQEQEAA